MTDRTKPALGSSPAFSPPRTLSVGVGATHRSHPLGDFFAFVIPLAIFVEFLFIGRLFLSELLAVPVTLWALLQKNRPPLGRRAWIYVALVAMALGSQVITDWVRETVFEDWTRGWAKLFFVGVNFLCFVLLFTANSRRIVYAASGLGMGSIVQYFVAPHIFAPQYPWKFGVGFGITTLIVIYATRLHARRVPISPELLVGIVGAINFAFGYRSLGLICLLTTLIVYLSRSYERTHVDTFIHVRRLILPFGLLFIGANISLQVYEYLVLNGYFGDIELEKFLAQSAGDFGLLVGARLDTLGGFLAVLESPFIGYGSWARDSTYVQLLVSEFRHLGYEDAAVLRNYLEYENIPSHSYVLGAWVEGGFVASWQWFWAIWTTLFALVAVYRVGHPLLPLIVYLALNEVWNILFSPMGAEQRMLSGIALASTVVAYDQSVKALGREIRLRW